MKRARHIKLTEREFKKCKRRQMRAVQHALQLLRFGCSYMPRNCDIRLDKIQLLIDELHTSCLEWWKKA